MGRPVAALGTPSRCNPFPLRFHTPTSPIPILQTCDGPPAREGRTEGSVAISAPPVSFPMRTSLEGDHRRVFPGEGSPDGVRTIWRRPRQIVAQPQLRKVSPWCGKGAPCGLLEEAPLIRSARSKADNPLKGTSVRVHVVASRRLVYTLSTSSMIPRGISRVLWCMGSACQGAPPP